MSNGRGQYGNNGVIVGQAPPTTIYVERQSSSIGAWLLGAVVVGGGILYARHQSQQIAQLYKKGGMPYQTFTGSLREALPTRARQTYRAITGYVRPKKTPAAIAAPAAEVPTSAEAPAHSARSRSGKR
jgi:hypothetical protein